MVPGSRGAQLGLGGSMKARGDLPFAASPRAAPARRRGAAVCMCAPRNTRPRGSLGRELDRLGGRSAGGALQGGHRLIGGVPTTYVSPMTQMSEEEAQATVARLRMSAGRWREQAEGIKELQAAGYKPEQLESASGLSTGVMTELTSGLNVYTSIEGECDGQEEVEKLLGPFMLGGYELLAELRTLSAPARKDMLAVCLDKGLDREATRQLCSVHQKYLRKSRPEGFSASPGDAMAYESLRAAKDLGKNSDKGRAILERGLSYAVSDAAKAMVEAAMNGSDM